MKVVPFPSTRRKVFIQGLATAAARYAPAAAERYLESKIKRHAERLRRCGVAEALVETDVSKLRQALNAALTAARGVAA